jgi:GNAT superfamily N-acetyltransferase
MRFFTNHPELSPAEVERFTHVDYDDRLALVVEHDGALVAVARYDRLPDTSEAEVAFVVTDEFQHLGIGTLLLDDLAGAALSRGIMTFVASTLAENHSMLGVFYHSGYHITSNRDHETVSLRFSIEPDDRTRTALAARRADGAEHRVAQRAARCGDDPHRGDRDGPSVPCIQRISAKGSPRSGGGVSDND